MMEWTDESIIRLRGLWQEGLSTAEIGRRMQITKNAVVGKAHRLTLPARPSPIRKSVELAGTALQPRRTPANDTLAKERTGSVVAMTSAPPVTVAAAPSPVMHGLNVQALRPAAATAPEPAASAEAEPALPQPLRAVSSGAARRGLSCCWPLGEPGTKQFRFCGDDPISGKPYCATHVALAYVKLRDRREIVA